MSPLVCEIRVGGSVPATVLEELDGMRVFTGRDETVLRGAVPDQSALIGVIIRLQRCGIDLRGIRQVGPGEDPVVTTQDAETVLCGPVPDQGTLITIICRLQGLGIDLRGLRQLGPGDMPAGAETVGRGRAGNGVPGYEIRVAGRIGPVVATCLQQFHITRAGDGAQARDGRASVLSTPLDPSREE